MPNAEAEALIARSDALFARRDLRFADNAIQNRDVATGESYAATAKKLRRQADKLAPGYEKAKRDAAARAAVAARPKETPASDADLFGGDVPATTPTAKAPTIEKVRPEEIGVMEGVQFKRKIVDSENNVTDVLKNQTDFETDHAGHILVYRDLNGNKSVFHGHHRRELGLRAEQFTTAAPDGSRVPAPRLMDAKVYDAKDGWTPESVKRLGVIANLRDGNAEAIDAADALVGKGTPQELAEARAEVSKLPNTPLAKNTAGLVELDENSRALVRAGTVSPDVAGAIGKVLAGDPERAKIAMVQAAKSKIRGYDEGTRLATTVLYEPTVRRNGDEQAGFDFGADFQSDYISTAGRQTEIENAVRGNLATIKSDLLRATNTTLREGENIDTAGRQADAAKIAETRNKADALFTYDVEVRQAIRNAAVAIEQGNISEAEGVQLVQRVVQERGQQSVAEIVASGNGQQNRPAPLPVRARQPERLEQVGIQKNAREAQPVAVAAPPETAAQKLARLGAKAQATNPTTANPAPAPGSLSDLAAPEKPQAKPRPANAPPGPVDARDPFAAIPDARDAYPAQANPKPGKGEAPPPVIAPTPENARPLSDLNPGKPEKPTFADRALKAFPLIKSAAPDLMNAPRSLQSSADFSAPLRQGAVFTLTEPRTAIRAGAAMFKAGFSRGSLAELKSAFAEPGATVGAKAKAVSEFIASPRNYNEIVTKIANHPDADLAHDMGLYLATRKGENIGEREEAFMSRIVGDLPHVAGSERAYSAYLDTMRMDVYSRYVKQLKAQGLDPATNEKPFRDMANFVNVSTGRGDVGQWFKNNPDAAAILNAALYGPRYNLSRVQFLATPLRAAAGVKGSPLAKTNFAMHPAAGKLAMTKYAQFVGVTAGGILLAKGAGLNVNTDDIDAPTFLQVTLPDGKTHLSPPGDMVPYLRLGFRFGRGLANNLSGKGNPRGQNPADVWETFQTNKYSPAASLAHEMLTGKDHDRQPFNIGKAVGERLLPITASDAAKAFKDDGVTALFPMIYPTFGGPMSRYEPKAPKGGGHHRGGNGMPTMPQMPRMPKMPSMTGGR